jgi:hypothetical protein
MTPGIIGGKGKKRKLEVPVTKEVEKEKNNRSSSEAGPSKSAKRSHESSASDVAFNQLLFSSNNGRPQPKESSVASVAAAPVPVSDPGSSHQGINF